MYLWFCNWEAFSVSLGDLKTCQDLWLQLPTKESLLFLRLSQLHFSQFSITLGNGRRALL